MGLLFVSFGFWPPEGVQSGGGGPLEATFAAAFVFGLIGLGVAIIGTVRGMMPASKSSKLKLREGTLKVSEIQLDSELAVILRFMRSYVDANDKYSEALARAHRNLHSLAKPEQVRALVKFLIAENAKR